MRWFLTAVLLIHGLIHLMGPLKAFGAAKLPSLATPISVSMGVVWLLAAVFTLAAISALWLWPTGFWALGLVASVVSQIVIVSAWPDAKWGTIANVLLLCASAVGFFMYGPTSLHAQFKRDSAIRLGPAETLVTEADLQPLPDPVKRYLRAVGVIGHPHVQSYSIQFRGRIRGAPNDPWMPFYATQVSFAQPPTRLFWMNATKAAMPVSIYHRLVDAEATMRVKLLGAVTMVDARGDVMDRAETVTLFNDMCILAPATLLSPQITWQPVDEHTTKASFTNGRNVIAATLIFGDDGLLADFVSDDRWQMPGGGKPPVQLRFSTPVRDYRKFGPYLLAAHGEARWHPPEGAFAYGEFDLTDIKYNSQL